MAKAAQKTRRYESPRRREQAEATRRAILEAAERLFVADGYTGTSMSRIASEARVALKTVYLAFETKAGVLRALWHLRLRDEYAIAVLLVVGRDRRPVERLVGLLVAAGASDIS